MEKLTRLCPVGLTLPKMAMGPTMVSAMTPALALPRTIKESGLLNADPASYHPPQ